MLFIRYYNYINTVGRYNITKCVENPIKFENKQIFILSGVVEFRIFDKY